MSRVLILGATGSLGRHVLRQALAAGHDVTVFVRTPSKLAAEVLDRVSVPTGDLSAPVRRNVVNGQDALINCAGHVADGETFVDLVERLVTCVDVLPTSEQPVCWLRISLDPLPVEIPAVERARSDSSLLPVFASLIPQMIVPDADAAAVMRANLGRGSAMSRHRVGLALPVGMHRQKPIASAGVEPSA